MANEYDNMEIEDRKKIDNINSILSKNLRPSEGKIRNFPLKMRLPRDVGNLMSHNISDEDELNDKIKVISEAFSKFKFGCPDNEFKQYYVFNGKRRDAINYIARSTEIWLENLLNGFKIKFSDGHNIAPVCLIGPTGCGKSTWIKYNLSVHQSLFMNHFIIPSRFEYRRFLSVNNERINRNEISHKLKTYMLSCIVRDIIYYLGRKGWLVDINNMEINKNDVSACNEFFFQRICEYLGAPNRKIKEFVEKKTHYDREKNSALGIIAFALHGILNGKKQNTIQHFISIPDNIKAIIINFAVSMGFKFLSIYDGFDVISIDDYVTHRHNPDVITHIFNIINSKEAIHIGNITKHPVPIATMLVLRTNTFHIYGRNHRDAHGTKDTPCYEIIPPSFEQIFLNRSLRLSKSSLGLQAGDGRLSDIERENKWEKSKDAFAMGYAKIQKRIVEYFEIDDGNLDSLFNNNFRRCLRYFESIFHDCVKQTHIDIFGLGKINLDNSMDIQLPLYILNVIHEVTESRPYIFVRMLLRKNSVEFYNAVTAHHSKNNEANPRKFDESPSHTGYIDNVFDYCIADPASHMNTICLQRSDTVYIHFPLLLKFRILQILDKSRSGHLSVSDIMYDLREYFGYHCIKEETIEECVGILLFTGMISVEAVGENKGTDDYRIQYQGIACIRHIALTMAYIEQVCHKSYMPRILCEELRIYQDTTPAHDVPNAPNLRLPWYKDTIPNSYVFLQYIKFCEENEDKYTNQDGRKQRELLFGKSLYKRALEDIQKSSRRMMLRECGKDINIGRNFMNYVITELNKIQSRLL